MKLKLNMGFEDGSKEEVIVDFPITFKNRKDDILITIQGDEDGNIPIDVLEND